MIRIRNWSQWLNETPEGKKRYWFLVVASGIGFLLLYIRTWTEKRAPIGNLWDVVIPAFQAVVIAIMFWMTPRISIYTSQHLQHAFEVVRQFAFALSAALAFLFVQYCGFCLGSIFVHFHHFKAGAITSEVTNDIARMAVAFEFVAYYVLTYKTVGRRHAGVAVFNLAVYGAIVSVALLALLDVTYRHIVGHGPDIRSDNLDQSILTVDGLLAGSVLALLVGRLDTVTFQLPSWVSPALMMYAMIQPLQAFFKLNTQLASSLFSVALLLKGVLWIVSTYGLYTGRMLFLVDNINRAEEGPDLYLLSELVGSDPQLSWLTVFRNEPMPDHDRHQYTGQLPLVKPLEWNALEEDIVILEVDLSIVNQEER